MIRATLEALICTGILVPVTFGFFPGFVLRFIVRFLPQDDERRAELMVELYRVPRRERPTWVFEQLEVCSREGAQLRRERRAVAAIEQAIELEPSFTVDNITSYDPRRQVLLLAQENSRLAWVRMNQMELRMKEMEKRRFEVGEQPPSPNRSQKLDIMAKAIEAAQITVWEARASQVNAEDALAAARACFLEPTPGDGERS